MDIPYNNRHMEDVRTIARKCIRKLISEFLKDLKNWTLNKDAIIKKWEEKLE